MCCKYSLFADLHWKRFPSKMRCFGNLEFVLQSETLCHDGKPAPSYKASPRGGNRQTYVAQAFVDKAEVRAIHETRHLTKTNSIPTNLTIIAGSSLSYSFLRPRAEDTRCCAYHLRCSGYGFQIC